jgi:riboflavin synthase
MFTGLVRGVGEVLAITPVDGAARLTITADAVRDALLPGASIAVDGVCLTVAEPTAEGFVADVMPETLARTTLGSYLPGRRVNLEPALRADDRLGGHVVQGHVDAVGQVRSRTSGARWDDVEIAIAPALARYVAEKGSICVNGVSLTVTSVGDDGFGVSLIPTTLAETTLGELETGSPVNIEVDVIAKYVERLLGGRSQGGGTSA